MHTKTYLTWGLALAALFLSTTLAFSQSKSTQALDYIGQQGASLGVDNADLSEMEVTHITRGGQDSFDVVYLQQTYTGIPIHNAIVNVVIDKNGQIISHYGKVANNLSRGVNLRAPAFGVNEALAEAAKTLGYDAPQGVTLLEEPIGQTMDGILSKGNVSLNDIPFHLVYVDQGRQGIRLAWEFVIEEKSSLHWWQIRMDAENGEFLGKNDWIVSCGFDHGKGAGHSTSCLSGSELPAAFAAPAPVSPPAPDSYNVYADPVESPSHGARTLEVNPADATASPFGWHDTDGVPGAEYTITRGNNVYASEDQNADNAPGFSPDGGATLDFDFPIDFSLAPDTYQAAAITNLFYWNNLMHDVLYQYGFDEASGNFQETNYTGAGLGSDYVNADALDGSGTNNANFGTPPDGSNPRMQMYVWTLTTPNTTSDLDNGIIAHEYGHGVSNRLTAGPANVGCLGNDEQMGEGWSDYFGLITTIESGDAGADQRGIGTYVLGQPTTGDGIRTYPYSTDAGINPHTYADITTESVPHGVGSVWCAMLWDMTWALIDQYGFDPDIYNGTGGNNIALQLVMDGMKLQPCQPGFVDGRDAILLADQLNNAGANQCLIWEVFAARGLGAFADQGSSGSRADGTEDFNIPCFCTVDPGPLGCTDAVACNYDPLAGCNDGTCVYPGCTDPAACNYNAEAGCDDGSCLIDAATPELTLTTDCWGNEVSWTLTRDSDGATVATSPIYGNQVTVVTEFCLAKETCYTLNVFDSYGDGMTGASYGACGVDGDYFLTDDEGSVVFTMGSPAYGAGQTHAFCTAAPVVELTKTASAVMNGGTTMTYTITVENTTAGPATGVTVTDDIPAEVSYVPGSASCSAVFADPTLTLDLGTMAPGEIIVCTYDVDIPATPTTTYMLEDDMESGAGTFATSAPVGTFGWAQVTTDANSGVTSWFAEDPEGQSDQYLDLTSPGPLTAQSRLSFHHNYVTEADWDGGVLEASVDGVVWDDLGASITQNGYDGPITVNPDSPISGRDAFNGNSGGWIETIVDLSAYDGQVVTLRWRMASDAFVGGIGWWIDDVRITDAVVEFTNTACVTTVENPVPYCDDASTLVEPAACIFGCTDATACNYDAAATCDDSSCILPDGCTDATACNYNAAALCDDGSCILPDGCTDATACNYNAAALCDDGSCILPDGCTDATACNYNAAALCDDGSCILPDGCTDASACNYNAAALCDDGSCILPDGCTDASACNYNAAALCDDGSCILPDGCTDPAACNYDGAATCDDGSCEYASCSCPIDLNNDGEINVSDLLMMLADFGCMAGCTADVTGDDMTNSSDLLALIGVFGTSCP